MSILYAYPMRHTVSFTIVARKHIEYMKKVVNAKVYEIEELYLPGFTPAVKHKLVMHPLYFMMHKVVEKCKDVYGRYREDYFQWWRRNYDRIIGVDVCDSDKMSEIAVNYANRTDIMVVPSSFCVDVLRRSGVNVKVYNIPHGVDPHWYTTPSVWEVVPAKKINPVLLDLYLYKIRKNKKFLLYWLWHSAGRKGFPEVYEVYKRIREKRSDVVLIMKTAIPDIPEFQVVMKYGAVNVYGWLSEYEKMALYDLSDINLNFSRGGGFEMNCLEALARGVPCIGHDYGGWRDYLPKWLWVERGERVKPLPDNALHVGYGYTVDVKDAVDKILYILDNLEEIKTRVNRYREEVLSKEYRWDVIAQMLYNIIMYG